ncbi:MAG: hypothetical protein RMJ38_02935 [candidate division WOR-3 bacterium]|nr:hypothetical protein [candidate division WOR-3 bacterium]MDW8150380.1 hypothetical protein [candidate division WOR-3 bacterium]
MVKIIIAKIYLFFIKILEAFILSLTLALFLIAIYPIKLNVVYLLSSIVFLLYIIKSLKYLNDKEIAWLYEFRYKELKEALITYVELKLKSLSNKIPFSKLNPFLIYRPKFEYLIIFVLSLFLLIASVSIRKKLYLANYGNYERKVIVSGNDEYFLGEDVILKFNNLSLIDEEIVLVPTNRITKLNALSQKEDTIRNLDENIYKLKFHGNDIFKFKVFKRPSIDSLIIRVKTPYLNLKQSFKNTYEITALEGSDIEIHIFSDADSVKPFNRTHFKLNTDTSFPLYLHKSKKFYKYPNTIKITAIKDNPPYVEILYPKGLVYLPEDYKILIFGISTDDYGLKRVEISLNDSIVLLSKPDSPIKDTIMQEVDLSNLRLLPGDELKIYLSAIDLKGQKSSDFITVRFPTLAEQMEFSNQGIAKSQDKIEDIKNKIDDLAEELRKLKNTESLENISKELINIQKEMEEIKNQIDETTSKLQLDPELQEQLSKISELYQKILNDELKQLLNKIQKALEKVNKEEIRKQLENVKIDIEKLKSSLKATEKTLRKFYEEQKLKEISQKLKEISQKQENVKSKEQQSQVTKDLSEVKKDLDDISKTIEQPFSDSLKDIQKDLDRTIKKSETIKESWPNSSGECKSNAQDIMNLAQAIENLQKQLVQSRKEEIIKKIEALRRSLIFISQNQNTKDEEEQKSIINAIKLSIRDFEELSTLNFLITMDVKANLYMALENAQEVLLRYRYNDYKRAKEYKNIEKKEVLEAILKLYNIQNEVSQSSSSSGYSEMLRKMSEMLSKMESMNNQQLSDNLLKEFLAQQEMLRKFIQGIREGMEKVGQGDKYSEKLREIEKQIDDLEKEISDKKRIDRRIIEKQREIMHKLLDAWTGLKSREKIEKFEAQRPENVKYEEPKISENMIYRQKIIEILRSIQRMEMDANTKNRLIEFYQHLLREF